MGELHIGCGALSVACRQDGPSPEERTTPLLRVERSPAVMVSATAIPPPPLPPSPVESVKAPTDNALSTCVAWLHSPDGGTAAALVPSSRSWPLTCVCTEIFPQRCRSPSREMAPSGSLA